MGNGPQKIRPEFFVLSLCCGLFTFSGKQFLFHRQSTFSQDRKQKAVLSNADTQIESSYNTYLNPGLPPGPICSPGLASIEAALNPADTDYLYFVLSEKLDGSANFSDNYEKFQKDANAYYAAVEAAS